MFWQGFLQGEQNGLAGWERFLWKIPDRDQIVQDRVCKIAKLPLTNLSYRIIIQKADKGVRTFQGAVYLWEGRPPFFFFPSQSKMQDSMAKNAFSLEAMDYGKCCAGDLTILYIADSVEQNGTR